MNSPVLGGTARRLAVVSVALALVAACSADAQPTASAALNMCGDGNRSWPPNGYQPVPPGLMVELRSGTTVRVRNATDQAWTAEAAPWDDVGCGGWMSAMAPHLDLAAHAALEATVPDPGWGWPLRIGVAFWDQPCGEKCQSQPAGFAWVDAPGPPSPS
jgi:hypothetical protein